MAAPTEYPRLEFLFFLQHLAQQLRDLPVRLRGSDRADGWFGIAGEQGPGAIGTSPISAGTAVELGKKFLDLLQPGISFDGKDPTPDRETKSEY